MLATLTPSVIADVTYLVNSTNPVLLTITFPPFTSDKSLTTCGVFEYSYIELGTSTIPQYFTVGDPRFPNITLQTGVVAAPSNVTI